MSGEVRFLFLAGLAAHEIAATARPRAKKRRRRRPLLVPRKRPTRRYAREDRSGERTAAGGRNERTSKYQTLLAEWLSVSLVSWLSIRRRYGGFLALVGFVDAVRNALASGW